MNTQVYIIIESYGVKVKNKSWFGLNNIQRICDVLRGQMPRFQETKNVSKVQVVVFHD